MYDLLHENQSNSSTTPLALIIGGSSGMGKQTGMRLLNRGAELMLLAHNPTKLEQAKAELEAKGPVSTNFTRLAGWAASMTSQP